MENDHCPSQVLQLDCHTCSRINNRPLVCSAPQTPDMFPCRRSLHKQLSALKPHKRNDLATRLTRTTTTPTTSNNNNNRVKQPVNDLFGVVAICRLVCALAFPPSPNSAHNLFMSHHIVVVAVAVVVASVLRLQHFAMLPFNLCN